MDANNIRDTPARWPISHSEKLYEDRWPISLRADTLDVSPRSGGSGSLRRLVLEHPGSVVILALSDEGDVLCLKQYRHAVGLDCLELPGGIVDRPDEAPIVAAQRELREEAGLQATMWNLLSTTYPSAGLSTESVNIYLAQELTRTPMCNPYASIEESVMDLFWIPLSQLTNLVLEGKVQNAQLVLGILTYQALRNPN